MVEYNDFALPPEEEINIMAKEFGKAVKSTTILKNDDSCEILSKIFKLQTQQLSTKAHTKFAELNSALNNMLRFSLKSEAKQTINSLIEEEKNIYQKFSVAFKTNDKIQATKISNSNFFALIKISILLVLQIILNLMGIKTTENNLEKEEIFDILLKELTEFAEKLLNLM